MCIKDKKSESEENKTVLSKCRKYQNMKVINSERNKKNNSESKQNKNTILPHPIIKISSTISIDA